MPSSSRKQREASVHKDEFVRAGHLSAQEDTSRSTEQHYEAQHKQLREELEDIGRNERSMKPAALAGHDLLLGCPAVSNRLGERATDDERRKTAHITLLDAIDALPSTVDEQIGRAILAATDEFEGKIVDERRAILDSKYNIGEGTFKRRRRKVLDFLAAFLLSTGRSAALSDYVAALHNLRCLFRDVAHLYYAGRAYSFVKAFDKQLCASPSAAQVPRREMRIVTETIYSAYLELILSGGYCLDDADYATKSNVSNSFPGEMRTLIGTVLSEIFDCLPFDSEKRQVICQDRYECPTLSEYRQRLEIFRSMWDEWAAERLCSDASIPIYHTMTRFLGPCYNTLELAGMIFNVSVGDSRLIDNMVKVVADYYGLGILSPVLEDKSLETHCREYLEKWAVKSYYALTRTTPLVKQY